MLAFVRVTEVILVLMKQPAYVSISKSWERGHHTANHPTVGVSLNHAAVAPVKDQLPEGVP